MTSPNPAEDVAFVFTEGAFAEIAQMEADQKFTGPYGAIIDDLLRQQARHGIAQVVMRNPDTKEEVVVRIPGPMRPFLEIHTPFGRKTFFSVSRLLRPDRETQEPEELMTDDERTLEAITTRLRGVVGIPITDDTPDAGQHYGYRLGVGNNTLGTLWHCTDDRTHPDHDRHVQQGWDTADLYMNSHFASVDDEAAFAFLLNARQDIQVLLGLLGVQVEIRGEEEDG